MAKKEVVKIGKAMGKFKNPKVKNYKAKKGRKEKL